VKKYIPIILSALLIVSCRVSKEKAEELKKEATVAAASGDIKTTRSLLKKVVKSQPEMADAAVDLIGVYILDGDIKKARETLNKAVKAVGETEELAAWSRTIATYEGGSK
jgi:thioredoxin-like negative regulator of GroEL